MDANGPVVVQLKKWDLSHLQLNLAEYREAFLSPSRELLLLRSYHSEALLISLAAAASGDADDLGGFQRADFPLGRSSLLDQSTSSSESSRHKFDTSTSHSFIADVKYSSWARGGDAYLQHEDAVLKELLVVCGDHGATVHGFCSAEERKEAIEPVHRRDETVAGRWVQWSLPPVFSLRSSHDELPINEMGERSESTNFGSKKWLRTFLTEVNTIECKGDFVIKFPVKSSLSRPIKVISFHIDFNNLMLSGFFSGLCKKQNQNPSKADLNRGPVFTDAIFKCTNVVSSPSHCLIGFVLEVEALAHSYAGEKCPLTSGESVIALATVHWWGIQWVSSVQPHRADVESETEWADFSLSDKLLFCLSRSGLMTIWEALTGKFLAHLHIACCIELDMTSRTQGSMCNLSHSTAPASARRNFKKLIVTSNFHLLAAVDDLGVVYVTCLRDCIFQNRDYFDKMFPHFLHRGLESLAGQSIAATGFGGQVPFEMSLKKGVIRNEGRPSKHCRNASRESINQEFCFNHKGSQLEPSSNVIWSTSQASICTSEIQSTIMRIVFLPLCKCGADSSICFSPFGITQLVNRPDEKCQKDVRIAYMPLYHRCTSLDDRDVAAFLEHGSSHLNVCPAFRGGVVGCCFQGFLYLVCQQGLFVALPPVVGSSEFAQAAPAKDVLSYFSIFGEHAKEKSITTEVSNKLHACMVNILNSTLVLEGQAEADLICIQNGWDLRFVRMHFLQMALHYVKFEEIEQSLEMLVDVNLAEEGILKVLFTAVHYVFFRAGSDNGVSLALRLLAIAICFASKIIQKYGLILQNKERSCYLGPEVLQARSRRATLRKLHEMAYFLEAIRNLQFSLTAKYKREGVNVVDNLSLQEHYYAIPDAVESEHGKQLKTPQDLALVVSNKLVVPPMESNAPAPSELNLGEVQAHGSGKQRLLLENPKDMITRWKDCKLDLEIVVKDALQLDRLPLAVLQLHLQHSGDFHVEKDPCDSFTVVQEVGRGIAYDLFLKGETGLAVATLQRLGEDVNISLRELLLGTVNKILRRQVVKEMKRWGYLGPLEEQILEQISLLERLYPSSSFWGTFFSKQKQLQNRSSCSGSLLQLICFGTYNNFTIECGEIDDVVLGSWKNLNKSSSCPMDQENDNPGAGYWAGAAMWLDAWDARTFDRVVFDQPLHMGVHILWESQLEYHACRNDWEEILKLLDMTPSTLLRDGSLQIILDTSLSADTVGSRGIFVNQAIDLFSIKEADALCIEVPKVKLFKFCVLDKCSIWLQRLIEQELAKKLIFMKECWDGTGEIVTLLARIGFISYSSGNSSTFKFVESSTNLEVDHELRAETVVAFHKIVVHHCSQYNLPNLLDLYLDHHGVASHDTSLLDAAGKCYWAKWLLLWRAKECHYDASLYNARAIGSHNIIHTVDDIAEGGGEVAALCTLIYAPVPIQKCLSSGSINRNICSSAQCTLENLQPALQNFPTLWRALVAACFGQDLVHGSSGYNAKMYGKSMWSDYLNWRGSIFLSGGGDTSLGQILPHWFSKSVRRLVQIFVQGPSRCETLNSIAHARNSFSAKVDSASADNGITAAAISWEAAIDKNIEDELYISTFKDSPYALEHYLHRGHSIAALYNLLGQRASKLKVTHVRQSPNEQMNIQSDMHTLLAPLSQDEVPLLSSVIPLAISNYENRILVASCAFLMELCGLSAAALRVDVAALCRISSYYKSVEQTDHCNYTKAEDGTFHLLSHRDPAVILARALADSYVQCNIDQNGGTKDSTHGVEALEAPPAALLSVLHHLEKASLPSEQKTYGSWLQTGTGVGTECSFRQKAASQQWSLVTDFCQMHHLPYSTKYLSFLARDSDWVGFLREAQISGCPFDVVVQVASKEFGDRRLRLHILNVLRNMQLMHQKARSTNEMLSEEKDVENCFDSNGCRAPAVELFALIAEMEKHQKPGEALLLRASELHWPLLAIVASCFGDASPLACMTVWLEISAAREMSSIKVSDIFSKVATNVGAAVVATNKLPADGSVIMFHYNRRNPKRRRLMEPASESFLDGIPSRGSPTSGSVKFPVGDISTKMGEERAKIVNDHDELLASLSKMVAVLCGQHLFLPLLRAFELFLPLCSLLSFIRFLQAFCHMRLTDAANHLNHFSTTFSELSPKTSQSRDCLINASWISATAVKAADSMLSSCPSPYEKRCLLNLLCHADFRDGGYAVARFKQQSWKINIAEVSLRRENGLYMGHDSIEDDAALLEALVKNGNWEQARSWACQLEASSDQTDVVDHITESQAESMVNEWKEFLWDIPEERAALWGHCQTLFIRHHFPALQAGLFFLRHAEALEGDVPARELHEMLMFSLQWLSGYVNKSSSVYPQDLLREIETRVWLLAVDSDAQDMTRGCSSAHVHLINSLNGKGTCIIDQTAAIIARIDEHVSAVRGNVVETNESLGTSWILSQGQDEAGVSSSKMKKRTKSILSPRSRKDVGQKDEPEDSLVSLSYDDIQMSRMLRENGKIEPSSPQWEERVSPARLERAVLSLLEYGQVTAVKQLQMKLSPSCMPSEIFLVDAALKLASTAHLISDGDISALTVYPEIISVTKSYNIPDNLLADPFQALQAIATCCAEGGGRGLCKRLVAVWSTANVLDLPFSVAFEKKPIELLQLLSLRAQDSFEAAKLLIETHRMPSGAVAQILAESFLKGLLAAHRGGYMDSQKEEGPAPLLWRFSDFLKWAKLCPSEPEVGHALMRLVITGQEIPHACEVELLILSHHFYKSSTCLDGVDVLIALAVARAESYVAEGDFGCLARLVVGVGNFHALNFILGILISNNQLELLLHMYSGADTTTSTSDAVRGFRMAILMSLKHFKPYDLDALTLVYNHFDMKHEMASLLESRAEESIHYWFLCYGKEQNEYLLDAMRYFIGAARAHSTIDAGSKARQACAQASLISLQIRMPDSVWLNLTETNARRALVDQSRFQEGLIVAEAYGLNQPNEWAPVLWNQMLKPEVIEQFVEEFVAVLPLQPSMLLELARFYRSEMVARGDQSHFSVWLSPGGLPTEWAKHMARSFRSLLKRTRDLRLRVQLAIMATGFKDVIASCNRVLDKVPEGASLLVLRRGHGGAYLPLM